MSENDDKVSLSEALGTVRQVKEMGLPTEDTVETAHQDKQDLSGDVSREAATSTAARSAVEPTEPSQEGSTPMAESATVAPSQDDSAPSASSAMGSVAIPVAEDAPPPTVATPTPTVTILPTEALSPVLADISVDKVAQMFTRPAHNNIETYLPAMLSAFQTMDFLDPELILTAFATVRAETAGFAPIDEYRSKYNTSPGAHPFNKYDKRADLGNRGAPDGAQFKGRGFIQLTGRANYIRYSKILGLGHTLIEHPEQANEPFIASEILAAFIQQHDTRIKKAIAQNNLRKVRRLVNGGSHGLKQFVQAFYTGYPLIVGE